MKTIITKLIQFHTAPTFATLFIWLVYGILVMWWVNDGWSDVQPGPPWPRPTPSPYPPTVHPNIQPAATPVPGDGYPPAIQPVKPPGYTRNRMERGELVIEPINPPFRPSMKEVAL